MRLHDVVTFDLKASTREKRANGSLFVKRNNLTMEQVAPYLGKEIGDCAAMGWDEDKVYHLYRDGAELEKAVAKYNALPLVMGHHDCPPENLPKDKIIGSIGTEAAYDGGYVVNSLAIWDAEAVRMVEEGELDELSTGYGFDMDPTPGEFNGQKYDARMTNIEPEHQALVKAGRAGGTVRVGDAAMKDADKPGHGFHGNQFSGGMGGQAKPVATTTKANKSEKEGKAGEPKEVVGATKDIAKRKGVNPKEGEKKYGATTFADPKNKKYPINTPEHVRAALSYWGMSKNRAKYSKADQAEIGGRIRAAAKRLGIKTSTGDAGSLKETNMKKNLSPLAYRAAGAIEAHLRTTLAKDAAIKSSDLLALVDKVRDSRFAKQIDGLAGAVKDKYKLKDSDPLRLILNDMVPEGMDEDDEDDKGKDEDDEDDKKGKDEDDEDDAKPKDGYDEDDEDDKKGKDEDDEKETKAEMKREMKKGADAAIAAAVKQVRDDAKALRQAERDVQPIVGDVELDTAEAVYRYALDHAGVEHKGVKEVSALKALVKLASRTPDSTPSVTHDSADNVATLERYPGLARISRIG